MSPLQVTYRTICLFNFVSAMADGRNDETQSIRDSTKSLKKYGSTCNHFKRPEHHLKHVISDGDTLQGIALKYGVTMEQIRRVNRLWASDSLFLREYLLIPVPLEYAMSPSNSHQLYDLTNLHSPNSPSGSENEERSIKDFLVKIDTSIATTINQVKKTQGNSAFAPGEDDFIRSRPSRSRLRQQLVSQSSNDVLSTPHPVVMTQGRKGTTLYITGVRRECERYCSYQQKGFLQFEKYCFVRIFLLYL